MQHSPLYQSVTKRYYFQPASIAEALFSKCLESAGGNFAEAHVGRRTGVLIRKRFSFNAVPVVERFCQWEMSAGSIAAMRVISSIASGGKIMCKEQTLLTYEQFERELNYDAALSVARRMLAEGLISRAEFVRIDAILREKFSPVWGGLYHSVA